MRAQCAGKPLPLSLTPPPTALRSPSDSRPVLAQVYAATHSVDVAERIAGLERAYPVTVGDDVWIGGNVCLIGPCKIGKNCTIAAGAVVRGDFPDNV